MSKRDFPLSDLVKHYEEDMPHHCLGRYGKDVDVYKLQNCPVGLKDVWDAD